MYLKKEKLDLTQPISVCNVYNNIRGPDLSFCPEPIKCQGPGLGVAHELAHCMPWVHGWRLRGDTLPSDAFV